MAGLLVIPIYTVLLYCVTRGEGLGIRLYIPLCGGFALYCCIVLDPGPPLDLTHDISANTVSSAVITWDPPSTTGGDGISITGYRIMSDNGLNNEADDMNYIITGLQYNTDYSVEVTAINSCGQQSEPASVVVNIEASVNYVRGGWNPSSSSYLLLPLKESSPINKGQRDGYCALAVDH